MTHCTGPVGGARPAWVLELPQSPNVIAINKRKSEMAKDRRFEDFFTVFSFGFYYISNVMQEEAFAITYCKRRSFTASLERSKEICG